MKLRIWQLAMWLTGFFILFGIYDFMKEWVFESHFDHQILYFIIGMVLLFFESRRGYRNLKADGEKTPFTTEE